MVKINLDTVAAIRHRIFKRGYKRDKRDKVKIFNKLRRPVYKKFLGLPALKLFKQEIPAAYTKKRVSKKKAVRRKKLSALKKFTINPILWSIIGKKNSTIEYIRSQQDILTFLDYYVPADTTSPAIPEFRAYIPRDEWAKMPGADRKAHILKRKELAAQGLLPKHRNKHRNKRSRIVKFSGFHDRLLLKYLTNTQRKLYLRSLVKEAIDLGKQGVTYDTWSKARVQLPRPTKVRIQEPHLNYKNLKKSLIAGKKSRKLIRAKLSEITCNSIVRTWKPTKVQATKPRSQHKNFKKSLIAGKKSRKLIRAKLSKITRNSIVKRKPTKVQATKPRSQHKNFKKSRAPYKKNIHGKPTKHKRFTK